MGAKVALGILHLHPLRWHRSGLSDALRELTGSKTSQPQRTAGTAGCAAAKNLSRLHPRAEFAKGASCAQRTLEKTRLRLQRMAAGDAAVSYQA